MKTPPPKLKILCLQHDTLWLQPIYRLRFLESKWSFSIDDGDDRENVTFKINSRFVKLCRFYANSLKCQMQANFPGVDFLGTALKFRNRKKRIRRRFFTSFGKRAISRHFHVEVMQWGQRNVLKKRDARAKLLFWLKVARYSFSGSIPPKFERKLSRHKQRFGKIKTAVVLDKDENLLWSRLQWHRSCHSNEMTPFPILLAAVFLGTGNRSSKIVYWSFYLR